MKKEFLVICAVAMLPTVALAADIPPQEAHLISIISDSSSRYDSANNDFQKGAERVKRAKAICNSLPSRSAKNWIGTVEDLSSTSDGYGVLSIRISDHITVSTNNNKFSDSLGTMKTLVMPDSPVFQKMASLSKGQTVMFSGVFAPAQNDCLEELSITQSGSMSDPEFEMKFTDVSPSN